MKKTVLLQSAMPAEYTASWLQYQLGVYPEINWHIQDRQCFVEYDSEDPIAQSFLEDINEFLWGEYKCVETEQTFVSEEISIDKKTLPLSQIPTKLTHVPFHLLYFQIPFLSEAILPWYYANFINTVYIHGQYFDYTDDQSFYENIFEYSSLDKNGFIPYNTSNVFVNYIKQDFYIISLIDNFYNSASQYYAVNHDVHHILIYGYDEEKQLYSCVFFEPFKPITKADIPYDEIHMGIKSARIYSTFLSYKKIISFVKPRELFRSYNRGYERLLSELLDYICGTGKNDSIYFALSRPQMINDYVYGIELAKVLIEGLQYKCLSKFDYRLFHLVADNKKLILERLEYIASNFSLSEHLKELITKYKEIVVAYEVIRTRYFKESMIQSNFQNFYRLPKKENVITLLIDRIQTAYDAELHILKKAFPLLAQEVLGNDGDLLMGKFDAFLNRSNTQRKKLPFYSTKQDGMLLFAGENEKTFLIPAEVCQRPLKNFTCSLWFNMNKYPETSYALIRKNDNDNEIFTFRILIESNGTGHGVIETENNAWYSEGTVSYWRKPLELNCWHHIILTYDGHQTAIYLDGAIQEIGEKGNFW